MSSSPTRVIIRDEQVLDHAAIRSVTGSAFATNVFSNGSEPRIIDALRKAGDLTLSLVAIDEDQLIGQVSFSPVTVQQAKNWYGLGPVAVEPDHQRRGVGKALIEEGLSRLQQIGAHGCALIGDPNYYHRFGFLGETGLTYGDVPATHVQSLVWRGEPPLGPLVYAPAFAEA